jgi:predicted permease
MQIALACVLVIGAGLLGRSFARLAAVEPGFDPGRLLVAELSVPGTVPRDSLSRIHGDALLRARALAGVASVALAYDHPLEATWYDSFRIPGVDLEDGAVAWLQIVSAGYLEAMRIPLRAGRSFTDADDEAHPRVVVVNEAFARRYFPGGSPVGRHMIVPAPTRPDAPAPHEIVGVAGDVRLLGLASPAEPAMYLPMAQFPQAEFTLLVRTIEDPQGATPALRDTIRTLHPDLPIGQILSMERIVARSVAQPRFNALLTGLFGLLALVLAALGVYGLLAYTVGQRLRELGVRLALGASPGMVRRAVLREGMLVALAGVAAGLGAAAGLSRLARSLLFQITPGDPATFVATGAALVAVALAASWIPVRRAARIDPLQVLREN